MNAVNQNHRDEAPDEAESVIFSPVFPWGNVINDLGQTGFSQILEIVALAATPRFVDGGLQLQTDEAGRDLAANQIREATKSVNGWINCMSLLLAQANDDVSDSERRAVAWAIVGMSELLGELHRACGNLGLPTMSADAVQQAIAAATPKPNRGSDRDGA